MSTAVTGERDGGGQQHTATGAGDAVTPFGQYRWDTRSDSWTWSQGMFVLHGYADKVPRPTTELVLQHKDPDSRSRAAAILGRARRGPSSYVNHHHIVDATGRTRSVLTVGTSRPGPDGGVVSAGFVADLTDIERRAGRSAVAAAAEGRAAVNQAQGAVMALLGLSADASLALLMWYSQNHHVKLSTLCRRVVAGLTRHGAVTDHSQLTDLVERAAVGDGPGGGGVDQSAGQPTGDATVS